MAVTRKVFVQGGEIRFVYSDETMTALRDVGRATVRRASHVEPEGALWRADLSPVMPVGSLFASRKAALAWEVAVLEQAGAPFPREG